jgi:1,2-diacylglycerol 3-beta-galactosyltransferase
MPDGPQKVKPRIQFLFSDTGGGHRASAQSVASALQHGYPDRFDVELLDPFVDGSRPLLRWIVYRYSWFLKHMPLTYGFFFHLTDNRPLMRTAIRLFGRQFRPGFRRNLEQRRPDAIVSFHPLTNHVALEAMRDSGFTVPFITVVTDMSEFHRFWLARAADMVVVPSAQGRRYCIERGLDPRRVHVAGLPVDPRFGGPPRGQARTALRARLGLDDRPTLLLVSGGEGSGRLGGYARALDRAELGLQLLVVCGRNERLRRRLQREPWRGRVHVYGFVDNMPDLMRVSDAIVTKAGPGTIAEALVTGLPIFLTSYIPGQEEGNVKFVVESQVGWYTRRVRKLVKTVRRAFGEDHAELERMKGRAEMLGRAGAAREIADLVAAAVQPPAINVD